MEYIRYLWESKKTKKTVTKEVNHRKAKTFWDPLVKHFFNVQNE